MITLASLFVYPVKSCRGIELLQAQLTPRGLQYDREWMVVSHDGRFLTQREAPRLVLVGTALHNASLGGRVAIRLDRGRRFAGVATGRNTVRLD